jgi:hypothetical protein
MNLSLSHEIDGYRVELDRVEGWRCQCGDFERANICDHTLQAAAVQAIERAHEEIDFRSAHRGFWFIQR